MRKLSYESDDKFETTFEFYINALVTDYFNADIGDNYHKFLASVHVTLDKYFDIPGPRYEYDPDTKIGEGAYVNNTIILPEILLTGKIENFADLIEIFRNLSHEHAHYYDDLMNETHHYNKTNHRIVGKQPSQHILERTSKTLKSVFKLNFPNEQTLPIEDILYACYYRQYYFSPVEEYAHSFEEKALKIFQEGLEYKFNLIKDDSQIPAEDKKSLEEKYNLAKESIKQQQQRAMHERELCERSLEFMHLYTYLYKDLVDTYAKDIWSVDMKQHEKILEEILNLQLSEQFYNQNIIDTFAKPIFASNNKYLQAMILGVNKETTCEQLDYFIKRCAHHITDDEQINNHIAMLKLKCYFEPYYVNRKHEEEKLESRKRIEELQALMQEETTNEQEIPHAPDYEAAMREAASIQADIPEVYKTPDEQENLQENTQSTPSPATQENLEK